MTTMMKKIATIGIAGVLALALAGCASDSNEAEQDSTVAAYADIDNMDFEYTERDKQDSYDEASATKILLAGTSATVEGEGASAEGSQVTIGAEGTYVVSGALENGQLKVNADENAKVQIVLANASIHNDSGAALYVEQADKCFITLASDTKNELSDTENYVFAEGEDEPNATLFSKDDLTINGVGSLTVTGDHEDGIVSKDDLTITGGTISVTAAEDGIRGKDSLKILDGTFMVKAGEDCLKSSRDDDPARGFVSIDGGTFTLDAGDDAIHGETYLRVTSGSIEIPTCVEGLEAMVVEVEGGDIHVIAEDDALNAAAPSVSSDATVTDGTTAEPGQSGEPGEQPAQGLEERPEQGPAGSTDDKAQQGFNEQPPQKPGEQRSSSSGDDRVPADPGDKQAVPGTQPDDAPSGDAEGMRGNDAAARNAGAPETGGPEEGNENCKILINGGNLVLEAKGDALDSNGSLEINGGTIYVTGPTSGGESALDYALDATCTGGTVMIVGSAGMAQDFSTTTQPSAFVKASGAANQEVRVVDQAGTTLISYTPTAAFEMVIVSSPDLVDGQSYTLMIGSDRVSFTAATKQADQKA